MSKNTKSNKSRIVDIAEDEEGWAALDEAEGNTNKREGKKKAWVPDGMEPVLEELPKWSLLAEVLQEIEGEIIRQESMGDSSSKFRLLILFLLLM